MKPILLSVIPIPLLILLASCQPTTQATANLPDCVRSDCNCSDFSTQQQAQEVLDAFPNDPHRLDRDGNGKACESLPSSIEASNPNNPFNLDNPDLPANPHLFFGNPSRANTNPNNYLMLKPQLALAYDCASGTPRWVSWELNRSWMGNADRTDGFRADPDLPQGCYAVSPNDYRRSGYDRGHVTPSADRTRRKIDNSATFLMTNIVPQTPQLNREVWRELEEYSRDLVAQGNYLYIIAGTHGTKGAIANGKITVPAINWKIVVALQQPRETITRNTRVIAVIMPNDETVRQTDWRDYLVTIDEIERLTGYDFLYEVPASIQEGIEGRLDRYPDEQ